jgi:hypothetical protein
MNAANRPIQTTRPWYETTRRKAREQAGPREERGLRHHPDGSGLAQCPECDGAGCHDTWGNDPQASRSMECSKCSGTGWVADGWRDPLLRLRTERQWWRRQKDKGYCYGHVRKLAMIPAWRIRLNEACVGCALATESAVQAWRKVA